MTFFLLVFVRSFLLADVVPWSALSLHVDSPLIIVAFVEQHVGVLDAFLQPPVQSFFFLWKFSCFPLIAC